MTTFTMFSVYASLSDRSKLMLSNTSTFNIVLSFVE